MKGLHYIVVFVVISQLISVSYAMPGVPIARMPAQCFNKTFCFERPDNYPKKIIDRMLQDLGVINRLEPVADRNGPEIPPNECKARMRVDPIYQIIDEHGNTRFVIQSHNFTQIIRTEECLEPGLISRPTRNLTHDMVSMNSFTCEQTTLDFKFVVLSLDGKSMEAVGVQGGLPVCCACVRN